MAQTQTAQGGKNFLLKLGNGASGAVTFQDTGDTVTLNNHGLIAGDTVSFSVITTTTGIVVDTVYYVVSPTTNTFQVAATAGGTALALTNNGTGTLDEQFSLIAGLRSTSFSLSTESIDISSQDSAHWKEILSTQGLRSVSISGDGVFKDEITFKKARDLSISRALRNWRVETNTAGDYWQGCFMITSLEQSGEYNAESAYSLSLESSGAISYTEV